MVDGRRPHKAFLYLALMAVILPFLALPVRAQTEKPPSAPTTTDTGGTNQNGDQGKDQDKQDSKDTKDTDEANPKNDRIFLVIPNYTTVEDPTAYTPIKAKEKFKLGAEDSFDPYSFLLAGIVAGVSQVDNDDASWGQGFKGYGKRYAAAVADTAIGSFMTTGLFPSILHEDPRYFRRGHGGFLRRTGYALERLVVITTDSNHTQFNYSEFLGNGVAAGISLSYHSQGDRSFSNFAGNLGTQIAIDALANELKEFWPDMKHRVFKHKKQ